MRACLFVFFMVCFYLGESQTYFRAPLYSFTGRVLIGSGNVPDSSAYLTIGPLGSSVKGLRLPRVADTAAISGTKRNGLMIYSNQLTYPAWYDSASVAWRAFGGETNTMSSAGGTSLYKSKTGVNFDLKGITAGSGITVTSGTNDLTLKADTSLLATLTDLTANYSIDDDSITISGAGHWVKDFQTSWIINKIWRNGNTVTINAVYYIDSTALTLATAHTVGTIPTNFRPLGVIHFPIPSAGLGGVYYDRAGTTAFTGYDWFYTGTYGYVKSDGTVIVYIRSITLSSRLYGSPYVIIPITVTYNIYDNS